MQVLGHLLTNFKALENLGYQMRKMDSLIRRVIKFDDATQDVVMDVRIADEWKRVRPAKPYGQKEICQDWRPGLLR